MRRLGILLVLGLTGCPRPTPYPDGRGLQGQLEKEVIALQATVRSLEYQLSICGDRGEPAPIYQDLHQILSDAEITVERQGVATVITIPGDYLFSGGTDIRKEAQMGLDLLATALNENPDHLITVEGHTDNSSLNGDLRRLYSTEWELTWARAEAVMHALHTEFDVDASRFTIAARADHEPIATNDTPAGRAKNRRIVVTVRPRPRIR